MHERRTCCLAERAKRVYVDSNGSNILRACYCFWSEISVCNIDCWPFFKHGIDAFFTETITRCPSEDRVYDGNVCNKIVVNWVTKGCDRGTLAEILDFLAWSVCVTSEGFSTNSMQQCTDSPCNSWLST